MAGEAFVPSHSFEARRAITSDAETGTTSGEAGNFDTSGFRRVFPDEPPGDFENFNFSHALPPEIFKIAQKTTSARSRL